MADMPISNRNCRHSNTSESTQVIIVALLWGAIFAAMLTLGACQEKNLPRPLYPLTPGTPIPSTKPMGFREDGWKAIAIPLPEPNRYQVQLSWSADSAPRAWLVHRKLAEEIFGATQIATLEGKETSFVDGSVQAGKTYTYFLGAAETSDYHIVGKASVSIPRDLEVTGVQMHTHIEGIHRLFFAPGSRLVTQGREVSIDVGEVISLGGTIENFAPGQTAGPGTDGRAGGSVTLIAQSATGQLLLHARGENGGVGLAGKVGLRGGAGARGNDGICDVHSVWSWLMDLLVPAAYAERDIRDPMRRRQETFCKVQTGDGNPGARGPAGENGGSGGRGGDSALFYVEIKVPQKFEVRPFVVSGIGGAGGPGGAGGIGGPGGAPGNRNCNECRAAGFGSNRPPGLNGATGSKGLDGMKQPVCIRLGNGMIGDCDRYYRTRGENHG